MTASRDPAQGARDEPVRFVVERFIRAPAAGLAAERELQLLEARDELRERARRGAAALDPGARHVAAVAREGGAGVGADLGKPARAAEYIPCGFDRMSGHYRDE